MGKIRGDQAAFAPDSKWISYFRFCQLVQDVESIRALDKFPQEANRNAIDFALLEEASGFTGFSKLKSAAPRYPVSPSR